MSDMVDERVVSMRFDNDDFERGAKQTIQTLDNLRDSLNLEQSADRFNDAFGQATDSLNNLNKDGKKFSLANVVSGFSSASAATQQGTESLVAYVAKVAMVDRYVNMALGSVERFVKSLTIEPLSTGLQEYELKIGSVQTILKNTPDTTGIDQVSTALDELNHYADLTIYKFSDMTTAIGKFTVAGVDLNTAVGAVKGVSNLAAYAGATTEQAASADYMIAQALSQGKMALYQYRSLEYSGMAGEKFRKMLTMVAKNVDNVDVENMKDSKGNKLSFRETLSKDWLTSEILLDTLAMYSGDYGEDMEKFLVAKQKSEGDVSRAEEILKALQDDAFLAEKFNGKTSKEVLEQYGLTSESSAEEVAKAVVAAGDLDKLFGEVVDGGSIIYEYLTKSKGYTDAQAKEIIKLQKEATDAATRVKTLTQTVDVLKESAQSGWTASWELIIGNFDEASELWTNVKDEIDSVIQKSADTRNAILKDWRKLDEGGRDDLIHAFGRIYDSGKGIAESLGEAWHNAFGYISGDDVGGVVSRLEKATNSLNQWLRGYSLGNDSEFLSKKTIDDKSKYLQDKFGIDKLESLQWLYGYGYGNKEFYDYDLKIEKLNYIKREYSELVKGLSDDELTKMFLNFDGADKIEELAASTEHLSKFTSIFGVITSGLKILTSVLGAFGAKFWIFSGLIKFAKTSSFLAPFPWIAGVLKLIRFLTMFGGTEIFQRLIDWLGGVSDKFVAWVDSLELSKTITTFFNNLKETIPNALKSIDKAKEKYAKGEKGEGFIENLTIGILTLGDTISKKVTSALNKVNTFITVTIPEWKKNLSEQHSSGKKEGSWFDQLILTLWDFGDKALKWISDVPGKVNTFFTKTLPEWKNKISLQHAIDPNSKEGNWFDRTVLTLLNFGDKLKTWFKDVPTKVNTFFNDTLLKWKENMSTQHAAGTKEGNWFDRTVLTLWSFGDKLKSWFKEVPGKFNTFFNETLPKWKENMSAQHTAGTKDGGWFDKTVLTLWNFGDKVKTFVKSKWKTVDTFFNKTLPDWKKKMALQYKIDPNTKDVTWYERIYLSLLSFIDGIKSFPDLLKDTWNTLVTEVANLPEWWKTMKDKAANGEEGSNFAEDAAIFVINLAGSIWDGITVAWDWLIDKIINLPDWWSGITKKINEGSQASTAGEQIEFGIVNFFNGIPDKIKAAYDRVVDWLTPDEDGTNIVDKIGDWVRRIWTGISDAFVKAFTGEDVADIVTDGLTESDTGESKVSVLDWVKDKLKSLWESVKSFFDEDGGMSKIEQGAKDTFNSLIYNVLIPIGESVKNVLAWFSTLSFEDVKDLGKMVVSIVWALAALKAITWISNLTTGETLSRQLKSIGIAFIALAIAIAQIKQLGDAVGTMSFGGFVGALVLIGTVMGMMIAIVKNNKSGGGFKGIVSFAIAMYALSGLISIMQKVFKKLQDKSLSDEESRKNLWSLIGAVGAVMALALAMSVFVRIMNGGANKEGMRKSNTAFLMPLTFVLGLAAFLRVIKKNAKDFSDPNSGITFENVLKVLGIVAAFSLAIMTINLSNKNSKNKLQGLNNVLTMTIFIGALIGFLKIVKDNQSVFDISNGGLKSFAGIGIVVGAFAALMTVFLALSSKKISGSNVANTVAMFIGLAVLIPELVWALKNLSTLDSDGLTVSCAVLTASLIGIAAIAVALTRSKMSVATATNTGLFMTGIIGILIGVRSLVETINSVGIGSAIVAMSGIALIFASLGAVFVAIGLMKKLSNKYKTSGKDSVMLGVAITGAVGLIWTIVYALNSLKTTDTGLISAFGKTVSSVFASMAAVLVGLGIASKLGSISSSGIWKVIGALAGVAAIGTVLALGLGFLSDNFEDFGGLVNKGGSVIGGFLGSLVGGFVDQFKGNVDISEIEKIKVPEGASETVAQFLSSTLNSISEGLPEIGTALTKFGENSKGFLNIMNEYDSDKISAVSDFIGSLGSLIGPVTQSTIKFNRTVEKDTHLAEAGDLELLGRDVGKEFDGEATFIHDSMEAYSAGIKIIMESSSAFINSISDVDSETIDKAASAIEKIMDSMNVVLMPLSKITAEVDVNTVSSIFSGFKNFSGNGSSTNVMVPVEGDFQSMTELGNGLKLVFDGYSSFINSISGAKFPSEKNWNMVMDSLEGFIGLISGAHPLSKITGDVTVLKDSLSATKTIGGNNLGYGSGDVELEWQAFSDYGNGVATIINGYSAFVSSIGSALSGADNSVTADDVKTVMDGLNGFVEALKGGAPIASVAGDLTGAGGEVGAAIKGLAGGGGQIDGVVTWQSFSDYGTGISSILTGYSAFIESLSGIPNDTVLDPSKVSEYLGTLADLVASLNNGAIEEIHAQLVGGGLSDTYSGGANVLGGGFGDVDVDVVKTAFEKFGKGISDIVTAYTSFIEKSSGIEGTSPETVRSYLTALGDLVGVLNNPYQESDETSAWAAGVNGMQTGLGAWVGANIGRWYSKTVNSAFESYSSGISSILTSYGNFATQVEAFNAKEPDMVDKLRKVIGLLGDLITKLVPPKENDLNEGYDLNIGAAGAAGTGGGFSGSGGAAWIDWDSWVDQTVNTKFTEFADGIKTIFTAFDEFMETAGGLDGSQTERVKAAVGAIEALGEALKPPSAKITSDGWNFDVTVGKGLGVIFGKLGIGHNKTEAIAMQMSDLTKGADDLLTSTYEFINKVSAIEDDDLAGKITASSKVLEGFGTVLESLPIMETHTTTESFFTSSVTDSYVMTLQQAAKEIIGDGTEDNPGLGEAVKAYCEALDGYEGDFKNATMSLPTLSELGKLIGALPEAFSKNWIGITDSELYSIGSIATDLPAFGRALADYIQALTGPDMDESFAKLAEYQDSGKLDPAATALGMITDIAEILNYMQTAGLGSLSTNFFDPDTATKAVEGLGLYVQYLGEAFTTMAADSDKESDITGRSLVDSLELIRDAIWDALDIVFSPPEGSDFGDLGISETLAPAFAYLETVPGKFTGIGAQCAAGFAAGLQSNIAAVSSAASAMAGAALSAAAERVAVQSPSREFMKIGDFCDQGLANGLLDGVRVVEKAGDEVAGSLATTAADALASVDWSLAEEDSAPEIRPVFDMSAISTGMANVDAIMAQKRMLDLSVSADNAQQVAFESAAITNQNGRIINAINDLTNGISTLKSDMSNLKVYIDKSVLVGRIAPDLNDKFGKMAYEEGRR